MRHVIEHIRQMGFHGICFIEKEGARFVCRQSVPYYIVWHQRVGIYQIDTEDTATMEVACNLAANCSAPQNANVFVENRI